MVETHRMIPADLLPEEVISGMLEEMESAPIGFAMAYDSVNKTLDFGMLPKGAVPRRLPYDRGKRTAVLTAKQALDTARALSGSGFYYTPRGNRVTKCFKNFFFCKWEIPGKVGFLICDAYMYSYPLKTIADGLPISEEAKRFFKELESECA
jgi:hypothetical protein